MSDPVPNGSNRRVGLHPALVIFGVIIGLWIFIQAIIPDSKNIRPPQGPAARSESPSASIKEARSAPVPPFTVTAHVESMKAVGLVVPAQTTDSQIIALLHHIRDLQKQRSLSIHLPATTPGHDLGDFAVADVYVFSDPRYATAEAVRVLSVGARAPGDFYQRTMPYEQAMEQVRGHYAVDLTGQGRPDHASLGFGEVATGLYSKRYRPLF